MYLHLSGLGDTFLPVNTVAACQAAGGTWNPQSPDRGYDPGGNRQCVAPVSDAEPVGGTGTALPIAPPTCGTDQCSWWDQIWVRDACLAYLRCANPTDPRVIAMDQGFFTGAGAAVGGAAGQASRGLLSGLFQNADGTVNFVTVGLIGLLGVVLISKK